MRDFFPNVGGKGEKKKKKNVGRQRKTPAVLHLQSVETVQVKVENVCSDGFKTRTKRPGTKGCVVVDKLSAKVKDAAKVKREVNAKRRVKKADVNGNAIKMEVLAAETECTDVGNVTKPATTKSANRVGGKRKQGSRSSVGRPQVKRSKANNPPRRPRQSKNKQNQLAVLRKMVEMFQPLFRQQESVQEKRRTSSLAKL